MPEMVLPGVYIEVRAEGLITPGRVTVGNIGIVGTANKGPVGTPVLLSTATQAREIFGSYDAFVDGTRSELSLVRALELAYDNGASTVFAVRIAQGTPQAAKFSVASAGGVCAVLTAKSPGSWANDLGVNVAPAEEGAFIAEETLPGAATVNLSRKPIAKVGRNRIRVRIDATGLVKEFNITYGAAGTPPVGSVLIDDATGAVTFEATEAPVAADTVIAAYEVPQASSAKVTIKLQNTEEVYTVADGAHLVAQANANSALVDGANGPQSAEVPAQTAVAGQFDLFGKGTDAPGSNGESATDADAKKGLEPLLNEPVHIVVAAGMDDTQIADELKAHCEVASTDKMKADRIAVVGSRPKAMFDEIRNHKVDSERVVFVAPGFKTTDAVSGREITLPGSYTAAVIAGMLSANPAHVSLTNKPLSVAALESRFTQPELEQLVLNRVLAVEEPRGRGIRVVKAITSSTNTAFHQITTRRIVDFAKYGVRSAASPYIGRLNNERVRAALQSTIQSFLQEMLDDEMVVKFGVEVTATRADEIKGIANVTIELQPTFSIDFIRVTMFLS
ncbi:MAG: phage tail sheath subtilisin-like domain-containing protein [Bryobacteraceae bacterium]